MNLFDLEVYEKKKAVPSARHKKNGSKSKKCKLSTDGLTQRQLQKRNGAIVTYQLNRPMEWKEFKAMPVDIQDKYLNGLVDKYGLNATMAGKVFGVTGQSVVNLLAKGKNNVTLCKVPADTEKKTAFDLFLNGITVPAAEKETPAEVKKAPVHTDPVEKPAEELAETAPVVSAETEQAVAVETKKDFKMSFFSLVFDGAFSKEEFMRSIGVMIPDGADVSVKVKVEFNK